MADSDGTGTDDGPPDEAATTREAVSSEDAGPSQEGPRPGPPTRTFDPSLDGARWSTLSLAAVAAVVVFVVSAAVFPYLSTNHDEGVYLQQAAMLLEGQVFLRPPVAESFRPWFFVEDGGAMYAKYTPVTAAIFALSKAAAGSYRVALAVVAAGNVALTVALGRAAFDHRTGALAGGLLLLAPLFVVSSSVFLSYAPATLFNLAFAYAYVRAAKQSSSTRSSSRLPAGVGWGAAAGFALGLAFWTRPYTAVLFATPFVGHAAVRVLAGRSRRVLATNLATAGVALAWVAVALAYNALVTGHALTFPYEAFAPKDGLGFGTRRILEYSREYTPALAVRANAEVVLRLFVRWVPLGIAGTALAAWGLHRGLRRPAGDSRGAFRDWFAGDGLSRFADEKVTDRQVRALLAAVPLVGVLGNVLFWGNLNVLGDLDDVADGLVWTLGPYYHFDVLAPTAIFAAFGARDFAGRVRDAVARARNEGRRRRRAALLAGAVLAVLVVAAIGGGVLAHSLGANYEASEHLADAYDVERDYDDAVVLLPPIYGDWLNHPLQAYRNDPGFDGDAVYAIDRGGDNFAVLAEYPDRSAYRYTYRGRWNPRNGESVEPRVQPVEVAHGDAVGVDVSFGTPAWTVRGAVELTSDQGSVAYYVNDTEDAVDARLVVADGQARLVGDDVEPRRGNGTVAVNGTETVTVTALLGSRGSTGLTYRVETPVKAGKGGAESAVMTPYLEACLEFDTCGGGAAYLPDTDEPGVNLDVSIWATNDTSNVSARTAPTASTASYAATAPIAVAATAPIAVAATTPIAVAATAPIESDADTVYFRVV